MRVWPTPLAFSHVTLARSRPLTLCCVLCILLHGFSNKSETARSLFTHYFTNGFVLFHEMMSTFFSALTRCGHEPVLLWCHAVKLTSFCGMAVNPVRILVPRLKQLPRKCKRGIFVVLLAIWQQAILTHFKQLLFWGVEDNHEENTVVFLLYVNGEF